MFQYTSSLLTGGAVMAGKAHFQLYLMENDNISH